MSEGRTPSIWVVGPIAVLLAMVVVAALIGYIWIPTGQRDTRISGLWNAICSAAGVASPWRPERVPTTPVISPSDVIVSAHMMEGEGASIGRGATLAMQCTMCHGARGMSRADSPNLAGQYEESIYKQLRDFKAGHRRSAIMEPLVRHLSEADMRDLAAYYAFLPRETPEESKVGRDAPIIVRNGAPMRNVSPCESCHGGIDHRAGSPRLDGEPEAYLRGQLEAFASGRRGNDLFRQMRNVARNLTSQEIGEIAAYYSKR